MFFRFLHKTSGATAVEYAIIAGLISIGIIVGVTNTGEATKNTYEELGTAVTEANQ